MAASVNRKIGNNPHPNTPARNASRSDAGGPSPRVARFEDEDDDEDEDEAPCEVARSSEGRRYRKQPKIDALRQYKEEILEAHRSGLSVHRIAQIFRERGVDISAPFGAYRTAFCRRRRAGGWPVPRSAPSSESHGKGRPSGIGSRIGPVQSARRVSSRGLVARKAPSRQMEQRGSLQLYTFHCDSKPRGRYLHAGGYSSRCADSNPYRSARDLGSNTENVLAAAAEGLPSDHATTARR